LCVDAIVMCIALPSSSGVRSWTPCSPIRSTNLAIRARPISGCVSSRPPEADGDLDPIALFKELDRPMDLRLEVARADLRRETDFLECHRALPALVLLLALGQFVLVLTEVEEPRDRRLCHRGDFDEIEPRSCAISSARASA
jgi:hypothetical protein